MIWQPEKVKRISLNEDMEICAGDYHIKLLCHNDTRNDVRGRTSGPVTVIFYILVTMTKRKTD
jgi:hypothetical protein